MTEESLAGVSCSAMISDNRTSWDCSRPAKGYLASGKPACGMHLAGEKRARANDLKRLEEARAEAAERERLAPLGDRLRALGLDVYQHGSRGFAVTLDEDEAAALADRLEGK